MSEEKHRDKGAFASSITVKVSGGGRSIIVGGAVLGQNMPRLIMLDEYRLESFLDGKLLIFAHKDVPGIIGRVGTVFGTHGINIAQMAVGREGDAPGGSAIGVLNIDGDVPEDALAEVEGIDAVTQVKIIDLPKAGELPSWLS
ncbi:D-3-phosphoglycerate dehydrogenase [Rhodopirellula maiorica SM1]|uniref:D-3-phosphoglycerate dehydrogenase n=1 Tax=Rhodopirellula maiorica SM1 TaxID=1265738 RepID=M5RHS5_9BACT|nr:D-3-phosphoglycerate dehydrogenase [Rhodopirellula maiorica SM1]